MRSPRTKTLFFLALGTLLLAAISIPNYYPAPMPVLAPDGSQLIGPDGRPLVHRDMESYYRPVFPGLILFAISVGLVGWWLVRIVRLAYEAAVTRINNRRFDTMMANLRKKRGQQHTEGDQSPCA